MKRSIDFVAALTGLLVLAPLLALIALAIWLGDRRNPLFLAPRVARGGGDFRMVKFRTMSPEAWRSGVNSTSKGDARITRIGRWLRRGKLDEIPQLWNVLTGSMSLVGPRPQVRAEVDLYTHEERKMLTVAPGVTDLASIVFADEGEILAGNADPDLLYNQIIRPWKSRLALLSLEHLSAWLDLRILWWTGLALVSRRSALDRVARLLGQWHADPLLAEMAGRKEPLMAHPPPGSHEIVLRYPIQAADSALGSAAASVAASVATGTPR